MAGAWGVPSVVLWRSITPCEVSWESSVYFKGWPVGRLYGNPWVLVKPPPLYSEPGEVGVMPNQLV